MPEFSLGVCLTQRADVLEETKQIPRLGKEQAKVYYRTTTSLYIIKPHVKGKVKAWKTAHTRKDAAGMKSHYKTHVLETEKKRSNGNERNKVNTCPIEVK